MSNFRKYINTARGMSVVWASLIGTFGMAIGVLDGFSTAGICAFLVVVLLLAFPLLLDDEGVERYFRFLSWFR